MKNILIIIANYDPRPSSSTNCMKPFLNELSKSFNIDILTNRNNLDIPNQQILNTFNIYRVDDYRIMNTYYSNKLKAIDSSPFLKYVTTIITLFLKTMYYIKYIMFSKEHISGGWEIKRVFKMFNKLDKIKNYELVISVSLPFQTHYIAEKIKDFKGENIKWVVFEFDPFFYNKSINVSKFRRFKMYKDEKRIFNKCDSLILTPELYDYYTKKDFIDKQDKFYSLPYATLNINHKVKNTSKLQNFMVDNEINCLFTGQLYDNIRSPKNLLKIFSEIGKEVRLIMMTNYTIDQIKANTQNNYLPIILPFQPHETALYNLSKANILINIGNTVELQVPAKVFEYMSLGKPIIHFSKIQNDPVLKYLEKYPLKLVINEWAEDGVDHADQVLDFCKKNRNSLLSVSELSAFLQDYTVENVIKAFIKIMNDLLIINK